MAKKTLTFIKVFTDTPPKEMPHSIWKFKGYDEEQFENGKEAQMELSALITQDVNDNLDNDAILEDLEDNGFTLEIFEKKIPKGSRIININV